MKLYCTADGLVVEDGADLFLTNEISFGQLTAGDDLEHSLRALLPRCSAVNRRALEALRAPIGEQEVWGAGVTYYRSRTARMEESKAAGGADFYDRIYHAERPELFFKSTPWRVAGPNGKVAIRDDSAWSVPEPELALLLNPAGRILGYTVGNDMSSRDIEGENPLYLPQAKVYDRSCALGPGVLAQSGPLPVATAIRMEIRRGEATVFSDSTTLASMKRTVETLAAYLFRNNSFPHGCYLLTGTGIVPPDDFGLKPGDEIRIAIDGIGELVNVVG